MPRGTFVGPPVGDIPARLEYFSIPEPNSGCVLWLGSVTQAGHAVMWARDADLLAHRLAWEFAFGPIPEGMHCLHHCDVPSCINPRHLFLGTNKDNMKDRKAKGRYRHKTGINHPMVKLTEEDVAFIRSSKEGAVALAARFGVGRYHIWAIRTNQVWKKTSQLNA